MGSDATASFRGGVEVGGTGAAASAGAAATSTTGIGSAGCEQPALTSKAMTIASGKPSLRRLLCIVSTHQVAAGLRPRTSVADFIPFRVMPRPSGRRCRPRVYPGKITPASRAKQAARSQPTIELHDKVGCSGSQSVTVPHRRGTKVASHRRRGYRQGLGGSISARSREVGTPELGSR